MLEDKVAILFKESTEMYCQGNYYNCLALLSDCLRLHPHPSILYSNRAIANFHISQIDTSFDDLHQAISANHLNYIAYFNLFSLHYLRNDQPEAFRNLCLCLSSAYTVLARLEPCLQYLEQSLHYCFNNKQSLFLKGLLLFQNQPRDSLELFKQVLQLQTIRKNREGVIRHMNSLENHLGLQKSSFKQPSISGGSYILQTNLRNADENWLQDGEMVKQFNQVYRRINEQMQADHAVKSKQSSEAEKEEVDGKDNNRPTTYQSTAYSRLQQERSADMLSSNKELKLISLITDQTTEAVKQDNIYPHKQIHECVKFFIGQAQLNPMVSHSHGELNKIYAILSYTNNETILSYTTGVTTAKENKLRWDELTDSLPFNAQYSNLSVKILKKRYDCFLDEQIAHGQIQITKPGWLSLAIYSEQEWRGMVAIRVEAE